VDNSTERSSGHVSDYYHQAANLYATTWDIQGRMHWGYFDDLATQRSDALPRALDKWDNLMFEFAKITKSSVVLDLGCGNGATTSWLARKAGCMVIGADLTATNLSISRVDGPYNISPTVSLVGANAMHLPFLDDSFTHIWCQATLCHVPDRVTALAQIRRVLRGGGLLALDDVITPAYPVSDLGMRYYYNRVAAMGPQLEHAAYIDQLRASGFDVLRTMDLTIHMKKSYEMAIRRVCESHPDTAAIYQGVIRAIEANDLGWAF
jgi:sarcosine/dimethylglycine N-methyltransferase